MSSSISNCFAIYLIYLSTQAAACKPVVRSNRKSGQLTEIGYRYILMTELITHLITTVFIEQPLASACLPYLDGRALLVADPPCANSTTLNAREITFITSNITQGNCLTICLMSLNCPPSLFQLFDAPVSC